MFGGSVEVLDGVSLSVEVSLIASIACASGAPPVADGRPINFGSDIFSALGHEVCEVDVGGEDGIGGEFAVVHLLLEPCEVFCCANLVEAVGIGRQVISLELVAYCAMEVNEVVLVSRERIAQFCYFFVGEGCLPESDL